MRYGKLTPEKLIDKLAASTYPEDKIVSTKCVCCGKTFYVLKSDLYFETDFRSKDEEFKLTGFHKVEYPKCPHCGYSGNLEIDFNK